MTAQEMTEIPIAQHARALFDRFGAKAVAIAARCQRMSEQKGEHGNAQVWRRVHLALAEMRGPAQS